MMLNLLCSAAIRRQTGWLVRQRAMAGGHWYASGVA